MVPSQSRDINDIFFLTNQILPRESLQHIYAVPKRSVLGCITCISLDPGLNTADTQTGQMPADPEPVLSAVKAKTGAVSRTVQKQSSDVCQSLADKLDTPTSSSSE